MFRGLFALLALVAADVFAASDVSFEDVISLRAVTATPAISPDGNAVLFSVRGANWKENRFDTEIWLAREAESPHRLVDGAAGPGIWSPGGDWVAFSKVHAGKPQLHLMRASGGEAFVVTSGDEGIGAYDWHPDGQMITFVRLDEPDALMKSRDADYGSFVVEGADLRMNHLWTIDVSAWLTRTPEAKLCAAGAAAKDAADGDACASAAERLTEGDFSVVGFDWARMVRGS